MKAPVDRTGQIWEVDDELILVLRPATWSEKLDAWDHTCLSLQRGDVTDRLELAYTGWDCAKWMRRVS